MAAEPAKIGFAPGFEYGGLEDFKGINTRARRPAIDNDECSWLENLMPIGKGNMRALYGEGATLYTASGGKTIVYAASYNIGQTDYDFYTLSDGTAVQVRISDGAVTTITATPNLFYTAGNLPSITQFGISGILIVTQAVTDGYFAWDGTLYSPGGASPSWLSGLTTNPALVGNESNGSATLSGFTSTVGVMVGMQVTGTGIPANTFVNGGTSTTVTITNTATATNTGVTFTFSWPMPTGLNGVGVDTYQGRVFIVGGAIRSMSAAGNGTYFASANGGNIATANDSTLRKGYTGILAANGYIYPFGDSSVSNISNVTQTTTNNVSTASYQYQNTDPQTGTNWPNTIQTYGRAIIFSNTNGIYSLLGNSATKISDQLDGLFATLDTSFVQSAGVGTIFGIRVLAVLIRATDYLGTMRIMMCMFDGKRWWIGSQVKKPLFIWTREINSNLTIMATDGTRTYPLFQTATASITKTMQSKLYGGELTYLAKKLGLRYYLERDVNSQTSTPPTVTADSESSSVPVIGSLAGMMTFVNNSGAILQFQNNSFQNLLWQLNGPINAVEFPNSGNLLGFTYTDTTPDFVIERTGIGYEQQTSLY